MRAETSRWRAKKAWGDQTETLSGSGINLLGSVLDTICGVAGSAYLVLYSNSLMGGNIVEDL
jgi:hypothetical protein